MNKIYLIEGMHCTECANTIEEEVNKISGVKVAVDFATNELTILEGKKKISEIKKAVTDSGYQLIEEIKEDAGSIKNNAIQAIILAIITIFLSMQDYPEKDYAQLLISGYALFYLGKNFFIRSYYSLKRFRANNDLLQVLGLLLAWGYSTCIILFSEGTTYYDSTATIVALILLGRFLETKAKNSAGSAIKRLSDLQPGTAILIKNNKEVEVKVSEIKKGDRIKVLPGQKIPSDGIIIRGEPVIDEYMLTGEKALAEKNKKDEVMAGTINKQGTFVFKAVRVGDETSLHKLIGQAKNAQATRAPIQKLADKMSDVLTIIVLIMGVLTFLIWHFIGMSTDFSLITAISVLLVASPSVLRTVTFTAVLTGIGKGTKEGIIVKNASALENLAKTDLIVFGKAGTLTKGDMKVIKVYSEDVSNAAILRLAGSLEAKSVHPIARAILKEAKEQKVKLGKVSHFEETPGGLGGRLSTFISIGTLAYMKERDMKLGPYRARAEAYEKEANTVIYVAKQKKVIGIIVVSDEEKPDAKKTMREIIESAEAFAHRLGIRRVYSQADPVRKAEIIKGLQEEGIVAFVGNRVNDAITLMQADVGMVLRAGNDIRVDASDITLMKGGVSEIKKAIDISLEAMKTIKQNLFFAFGYNIIAMPIAAGVLYNSTGLLLGPVIATAAMTLSRLSVISNGLARK